MINTLFSWLFLESTNLKSINQLKKKHNQKKKVSVLKVILVQVQIYFEPILCEIVIKIKVVSLLIKTRILFFVPLL